MQQVHRCELSFGEKIVKIGPVDPEIIWLKLIKKKLTQAKYTSLPASLLSRLKNLSYCYANICTIFVFYSTMVTCVTFAGAKLQALITLRTVHLLLLLQKKYKVNDFRRLKA